MLPQAIPSAQRVLADHKGQLVKLIEGLIWYHLQAFWGRKMSSVPLLSLVVGIFCPVNVSPALRPSRTEGLSAALQSFVLKATYSVGVSHCFLLFTSWESQGGRVV